MKLPRCHIDVIMPAFNAEATIARALDGARSQSHTQLAVIVVDDGSTDSTRDIVRSISNRDSRVRLLTSAQNGGPAAARNTALSAATGEWIALLDADDTWHPERLARMLSQAGDQTDVVFDNLLGFDVHQNAAIGPLFPDLPRYIGVSEMAEARVSASCYNYGYLKPLFRRSVVDKLHLRFDETLRTSEDLLFFLTLIVESGRAMTISEAYYVYTLPISVAGQSSPYSHSQPRDLAVADALEHLRRGYEARLTHEESAALQRRVAYLRSIAPVSEFHLARRAGDLRKAFDLVVRSAAVRRELARTLARRLSKYRAAAGYARPEA